MKETDGSVMIDLSSFDRSKFTNVPHEQIVKKPWGYEVILTPPELPYTSKILHVDEGQMLSEQVHDKKIETITLNYGEAVLRIDNQEGKIEEIKMELRKGYTVHPGQRHRVIAIKESEIYESSTPEIGTTYRLNDKYGREDETEEIRRKERAEK